MDAVVGRDMGSRACNLEKSLSRIAVVVAVLVLAVIGVTQIAQGATHSASGTTTGQDEAFSYTKPTGPEMTPTGAAEHALHSLTPDLGHRDGASVTLRVVYGTFGQLRAVLDRGTESGPPTVHGSARCFPGLPCQPAEVTHMEQIEREINESAVYLVELSGATFSSPRGAVPPGHAAISGQGASVIIDAHTGFITTEVIGGPAVDLEGLGTVSAYTATLSESGTAATLASLRPSSSLRYGRIFGHVVGRRVIHLGVVLSAVGHGVPLEGQLVSQTTVGKNRTFTMRYISPGLYGVGVRRGGCNGKKIRVKAERTTEVTLVCD